MNLQELAALAGERCHLAIFVEPYLGKLLSGQKTIESRWMKHKIAPYGRVKTGDLVYVKKSGGPVVASFRAGIVYEGETNNRNVFEGFCRGTLGLAGVGIVGIAHNNASAICVDTIFIDEQAKTKTYAVLIEVTKLEKLPPFSLEKKGMQAWVTLEASP